MATDNGYHTHATGEALQTVERHSEPASLQLYCACFCPFAQRVWIMLEELGLPYQYIEIDPYRKPKELMEISPKGLVPAIRHGNWGLHESAIIMEYLEALCTTGSLLPKDPKALAEAKLWSDWANRNIMPAFYKFLQEQDETKRHEFGDALSSLFEQLASHMDAEGPFFQGPTFGWVDTFMAPWLVRVHYVLKPYRDWSFPASVPRLAVWDRAVMDHPSVKATISTPELYLESYQRYAENRPNTSMVANAINKGEALP